MLEILLIFFLAKRIGEIVESKGYPPLPFQLGFVGCWLVGELMGALIGWAVALAGSGGRTGAMCAIYLFALFGAACGAGVAFLVAAILPEKARERSFMDDYYEARTELEGGGLPRKKRRRRRDWDDDEERPRRRRSEEDDYDDRPRRRRRSDDDYRD
jgi:hypothetical protein